MATIKRLRKALAKEISNPEYPRKGRAPPLCEYQEKESTSFPFVCDPLHPPHPSLSNPIRYQSHRIGHRKSTRGATATAVSSLRSTPISWNSCMMSLMMGEGPPFSTSRSPPQKTDQVSPTPLHQRRYTTAVTPLPLLLCLTLTYSSP